MSATTACVSAPPATGRLSECICFSRTQLLVGEAHRIATVLEQRLPVELSRPAEVMTHLESLEDDDEVHSREHYTDRPE